MKLNRFALLLGEVKSGTNVFWFFFLLAFFSISSTNFLCSSNSNGRSWLFTVATDVVSARTCVHISRRVLFVVVQDLCIAWGIREAYGFTDKLGIEPFFLLP